MKLASDDTLVRNAHLFPANLVPHFHNAWFLAGLWEEECLRVPDCRLNGTRWNAFASTITVPLVNRIANTLTGYGRAISDPDFQSSQEVYPGDKSCNAEQPHSKWHEVSANALVDLIFFADNLIKEIRGEKKVVSYGRSDSKGLFDCLDEDGAFESFDTSEELESSFGIVLENCSDAFLKEFADFDVDGFLGVGLRVLVQDLHLAPAHAAGSNMPWEQPLQQVLESIEGPVAKIIAVIIIIVTGLTLAFGDTSGGFRRLVQIVFGISIAFAASSFFLSFFQFGGGALI